MAGGNDEALEKRIGNILQQLLNGVRSTLTDVAGAAEPTTDLRLGFSDGAVAAVEVTRFTNEGRRRFDGQTDRYHNSFDGLKHDWYLTTTEPFPDLKQLTQSAGRQLQSLEEAGQCDFPNRHNLVSEAVRELEALSIWSGDGRQGDGRIFFDPSTEFHAHEPSQFNERVQDLVRSNSRKLTNAAADDTVLAIWVDLSSWAGAAPMSHEGELPTQTRDLHGIDLLVAFREPMCGLPYPDRRWTYGETRSLDSGNAWSDMTHRLAPR